MGLAYVGTPCTGDRPCAINEDGGLVLSTVVAHEMGHVYVTICLNFNVCNSSVIIPVCFFLFSFSCITPTRYKYLSETRSLFEYKCSVVAFLSRKVVVAEFYIYERCTFRFHNFIGSLIFQNGLRPRPRGHIRL